MRKIVRLELDDDIVKSAGYKSVEDFTDFFINKSNPYDGLFIKNKTPYFNLTDDGGTMCLDLAIYEDNKPENNLFVSFCFGTEDFECCASYFQVFCFHKDDIDKRIYKITSYYETPLKESIGYYNQ